MEQPLTGSQMEALLYAGAMALLVLTSWLAGRRARRVLGRALGREVREGEETSLRAWMSLPPEKLATAEEELRSVRDDQIAKAVEAMNRGHRFTRYRNPDDHQPYSEYPSIR